MGGLVIVTVRDGVQFAPDAAAAFQRAEAQLGRQIDVNSTWRSWSKQLDMHHAWNAYANGTGPHPGHSKAVHPRDSFHVNGTALDSDDWRDPEALRVLADNGFIRNRLYVPGEQHHFEYLRERDKNHGKEIDMPLTDADKKWIKAEIARGARLVWTTKSVTNGQRWGDMLRVVFNAIRYGVKGKWHHGTVTAAIMSEIGAQKNFRARSGGDASVDVKALAEELAPLLNEQEAGDLVKAILNAQGKALSNI